MNMSYTALHRLALMSVVCACIGCASIQNQVKESPASQAYLIPNSPIEYSARPLGDSAQVLLVHNTNAKPVRVEVFLTHCINVRFPCTSFAVRDTIVAPQATVHIVTLARDDPAQPWSYRNHYDWFWASPAHAAVYEAKVPGPYGQASNGIGEFFNDSGYRIWTVDLPDRRTRISVARRLKVMVETARIGGDSLYFRMTGEQYVGDTTHTGHTSGDFEVWQPLLDTSARRSTFDSLGAQLAARAAAPWRAYARSLPPRTATGPVRVTTTIIQPSTPPGPPVIRSLDNGLLEWCKMDRRWPVGYFVLDNVHRSDWCQPVSGDAEHFQYNTYVLVNPTGLPVGTRIGVCAKFVMPIRPLEWRLVEWYSDPRRCPVDEYETLSNEPNIAVLERVSLTKP